MLPSCARSQLPAGFPHRRAPQPDVRLACHLLAYLRTCKVHLGDCGQLRRVSLCQRRMVSPRRCLVCAGVIAGACGCARFASRLAWSPPGLLPATQMGRSPGCMRSLCTFRGAAREAWRQGKLRRHPPICANVPFTAFRVLQVHHSEWYTGSCGHHDLASNVLLLAHLNDAGLTACPGSRAPTGMMAQTHGRLHST